MRLSGQFFVCFFLRIISATHKKIHKTNKNQLTKQKQANIKQQKQQYFVHKNFIRGGILYFAFFI